MTLKPPTRTLPKIKLVDWPRQFAQEAYERVGVTEELRLTHEAYLDNQQRAKALSDFTRVVEEAGILDQERSQKADTPPRR